jgi:phage tail-like protein
MIPFDPFPSYNFVVTLDPADAYLPPAQAAFVIPMALGAFQEVKGLSAELEVTPYSEGGVNDFIHQLPLRHKWGRITLRRGITRAPGLWEWYLAGLMLSLGARRDGSILLLNSDGSPAVAWVFRAGLAAKWIGPDLSAMESGVAIEGLEIAHEGLLQVQVFGPPGVG